MNEALPKEAGSLSRQLLLLCCSVILIILFYQVPASKKWFRGHVLDYWDDCRFQFAETIPEQEKKTEYYGESYLVCATIAKHLTDINMQHAVLLVEPNEYLKEHAGIQMPEPVVFYYFSNGIENVRTNSPSVGKARLLLKVEKDGRVGIQKINSPAELQMILNKYNKYKNNI